jgi:GT2 family glycosyltransferase
MTFSVVVTFFNQREFVEDALASVLALDRDELEIIAVDDASTDGTADALRRYDGVVKTILLETNGGPSYARHRGAAEATGDYLVFLDGDDAFLPWAFDVFETIARTAEPAMIIGALEWFEGEAPAAGDRPRELRFVEYADYFAKDRGLFPQPGATAIARRALEAAGGWDPELRSCEDYDVIWRLGTSGPVVYVTEPAITLHRAHAGQTTQQGARLLGGVEMLVDMERSGRYPGGRKRALERWACVGGCVAYWVVTLGRKHPRQTAVLLLRSWPFVAAAAAVRLRAVIRGRRPSRTLPIATGPEAVRAGA